MTSSVTSLADLAREARTEADNLDRELAEIDLLVQQARMEASRHDTRRAQASERLSMAESRGPAGAGETRDAVQQLIAATRRASLMEAQIDVLEGKRRALTRYRDRMRAYADLADAVPQPQTPQDANDAGGASRAILTAQEDLRREIARQMHDGPAQSLANIALQAQIVQRLATRDPERAATEVAQLVSMVESTLDATKTFIFDVRPMVLDDLGLVPTIRRVARDRGRRARVPIEFESVGADRRLPDEIESGLFRIVDEAITGFLETHPARIGIRFDWTDDAARVRISGIHDDEPPPDGPTEPEPTATERGSRFRRGRQSGESQEVLPALAAMIEEKRVDRVAADVATRDAVEAARALPAAAWRHIQQRARSIGVDVTLSGDHQTLAVIAPAR